MKDYSILIVDDNEDDRYLLKRQINELKLSCHIFEADDGQSALNFFNVDNNKESTHSEKFPPVLVFLDINMPVLNGFGFLQEFSKLREIQNGYESIVIMVYTSSERDEDRSTASTYDFVKGYIIKGATSPDELEAIMKTHTVIT